MAREQFSQIRKRRLAQLIKDEYGNRQNDLAAVLDVEPNYISQLLTAKKSFGEKAARKIEDGAKKPRGWLDKDDDESRPTSPALADWPFAFDRALWDRLSPLQQREIESSFLKQVLGASIQEMASPQKKKSG